jgi:hypothetical protein
MNWQFRINESAVSNKIIGSSAIKQLAVLKKLKIKNKIVGS